MTSYPNISNLLSELHRDKDVSSHKSTIALSQIDESAIKILLNQVDTMLHQKRLKWERQKQEYDHRMSIKEQENRTNKVALEQKSMEINQLKQLLENMNVKTHDMMRKYETEIENLNEQLNKTKNDFIKMQKKLKKSKTNANSSGSSGTNRRSDRLGTPKSGMNSLNSSLSDAIYDTATLNQLETHQKQKYEHEIITLKSQLNEHKLKEMELYHEKENLQKKLDDYKEANLDLHRKINELNKSLTVNTNLTFGDKFFYETELRKKEEQIKNLENSLKPLMTHSKNHDVNELKNCKEEVKKYKNKETTIRHEFNKLKNEYNDAMKRLNNLENENRKIKSKPNTVDDRNKNNEIINLKKKINADKEQHVQEVHQLKNEIYTFNNQITEKNNHIRNLTEKINVLERVIKEKEEMFEKTNQELTMTLAHVEALRLENHFLRQSATEKKSDEKDIVHMQKKYHEFIELSEKENKKLKNEVIQLTQVIEELRKNIHNDTSKHTTENADLNYRRLKIVTEDYEKQIELLKQQHDLSVKRLNSEIDKLNNEKYTLITELDGYKLTTTSNNINTKNVTNNHHHHHFGNSISRNNYRQNISSSINHDYTLSDGTIRSGISSTNNNHNNNNDNNNNDYIKKLTTNNNNSNNNDELPISSRSAAFNQEIFKQPTSAKKINLYENMENHSPSEIRLSFGSQFRLDEQKRKKQLENLLDSHIDALRKSSGGHNDNILGLNNNILNTNYVRS